MTVFAYDHTFDGLLTCVYESFARKLIPQGITVNTAVQTGLFAQVVSIQTDILKADRVWMVMEKYGSKRSLRMLFTLFQTGLTELEMHIFHYIRLTLESKQNIELNFGNDSVLTLNQWYQKVRKEAMRVIQFTRFQKTLDDILFAPFDPLFDVIPLTVNHFKNRYRNEKWLIYDTKRKYGMYYNRKEVARVELKESPVNLHNGQLPQAVKDKNDRLFELMWTTYYQSMTIEERRNMKLHRQFMPRRFWKYLPEKQGFFDKT